MNVKCLKSSHTTSKLRRVSSDTQLSKYFSDLEFLRRLATFANWPLSAPKNIKPSQFASAGFAYTTFKDEVVCSVCGIELGQWKAGDHPMQLHRMRQPSCDFVTNYCHYGEGDTQADGEDNEPDEIYGEVDLAQNASQIKENKAKSRIRARQDIKAMEAENKELSAQLQCKNCKSESIQTLFLPCRHLVSCEQCAEKVESCFYCTTKIMGTVRTFVI